MRALAQLRGLLGGCAHSRTTFPRTPRGGGPTHVACVECGAEFAYDWDAKRMGARIAPKEEEREMKRGLVTI